MTVILKDSSESKQADVIIVGGGPAGLRRIPPG